MYDEEEKEFDGEVNEDALIDDGSDFGSHDDYFEDAAEDEDEIRHVGMADDEEEAVEEPEEM